MARFYCTFTGSADCPLPDHPHDESNAGQTKNDKLVSRNPFFDDCPVRAQRISGTDENGIPQGGANCRVQGKGQKFHSFDASRNGNQGTNNGNDASQKNCQRASAHKPRFGALDISFLNEGNLRGQGVEARTPKPRPQGIQGQRTSDRSERCLHNCTHQSHTSRGSSKSRGRQDHFARDWWE